MLTELHSDQPTLRAQEKPNVIEHKYRTLNPSPPPRVKSSLKLRPSLNRINSEPVRKTVHFSTTNLCDIRSFNGSQEPSQVSKHSGRPNFFLDGTKKNLYNDEDEDEDEDDDDDTESESDEEDLYNAKFDGKKNRQSRDSLSVALGLDDDDYDEDGISRVPLLKARPHRDSKSKSNSNKRNETTMSTSKGWTMLTPGFVPHTNVRIPGSERPNVYLENIQFKEESMQVRATVLVRNISYHKCVTVRFTFDEWKSINEANGVWSDDIRKFDRECNFDKFDVVIPLHSYSAEFINCATMRMCVKYNSNGFEYWDNNGGKNYSIYLRNQQLSKSSITAPQTSISKGRNVSCPLIRELSSSSNQATLSELYQDESQTAPNEEEPESFTRNTLNDSGLPHKTDDSIKFKNPFGNRYSFKNSFNGMENSRNKGTSMLEPGSASWRQKSPSLSPEHTESSFSQRASNVLPTTRTSRTHEDYLKEPSPPKTLSDLAFERSTKAGLDQTWESDSYKDFVSKYCFYTPPHIGADSTSVTKPRIEPALTNNDSRNATSTSFHN